MNVIVIFSLRRLLMLAVWSGTMISLTAQQDPPPPPGSPPSADRPQQQQREPRAPERQPELQRPIFLTGKVVASDGSPLPDSARVTMFCNGTVRREAYVFGDGDFTLELNTGQIQGPQDASVGWVDNRGFNDGLSGGFGDRDSPTGSYSTNPALGRVDLTSCELRANVPGFRSETVQLGMRSALDRPDVGTILVHRLGEVKGNTVSASTLAAPKDAAKSFEKAQKESRKSKPNYGKMRGELEKAVKSYPQFAEAWYLLGRSLVQLKEPAEAEQAFTQAIQHDADFVPPYVYLARLYTDQSDWNKVAEVSEQALKLNPYLADAHFYNSVAQFQLAQYLPAETSIRKFIDYSQGRQVPTAHYILGAVLATRGDFPGAATEFRRFLALTPEGPMSDGVRENLKGWETDGLIPAETAQ